MLSPVLLRARAPSRPSGILPGNHDKKHRIHSGQDSIAHGHHAFRGLTAVRQSERIQVNQRQPAFRVLFALQVAGRLDQHHFQRWANMPRHQVPAQRRAV